MINSHPEFVLVGDINVAKPLRFHRKCRRGEF
jgi:hypothetical protein